MNIIGDFSIDKMSKLPKSIIHKVILYLENSCASLLKKSHHWDCCICCRTLRPLFINMNYIGFRPAVLNQINRDFNEYWEPYLNYPDSDNESDNYDTDNYDTDEDEDLLEEDGAYDIESLYQRS